MITRMVLCCDTGLKRGKLFSLGLLMLIAACCSPIAIGQQSIIFINTIIINYNNDKTMYEVYFVSFYDLILLQLVSLSSSGE